MRVQISSQARLCSKGVMFTRYEKIGERAFLLVFSGQSQKLRGSTYLPEVCRKQQRTSGPLAVLSATRRKALGYFPT